MKKATTGDALTPFHSDQQVPDSFSFPSPDPVRLNNQSSTESSPQSHLPPGDHTFWQPVALHYRRKNRMYQHLCTNVWHFSNELKADSIPLPGAFLIYYGMKIPLSKNLKMCINCLGIHMR